MARSAGVVRSYRVDGAQLLVQLLHLLLAVAGRNAPTDRAYQAQRLGNPHHVHACAPPAPRPVSVSRMSPCPRENGFPSFTRTPEPPSLKGGQRHAFPRARHPAIFRRTIPSRDDGSGSGYIPNGVAHRSEEFSCDSRACFSPLIRSSSNSSLARDCRPRQRRDASRDSVVWNCERNGFTHGDDGRRPDGDKSAAPRQARSAKREVGGGERTEAIARRESARRAPHVSDGCPPAFSPPSQYHALPPAVVPLPSSSFLLKPASTSPRCSCGTFLLCSSGGARSRLS